jgi:hypothetical protein
MTMAVRRFANWLLLWFNEGSLSDRIDAMRHFGVAVGQSVRSDAPFALVPFLPYLGLSTAGR